MSERKAPGYIATGVVTVDATTVVLRDRRMLAFDCGVRVRGRCCRLGIELTVVGTGGLLGIKLFDGRDQNVPVRRQIRIGAAAAVGPGCMLACDRWVHPRQPALDPGTERGVDGRAGRARVVGNVHYSVTGREAPNGREDG